MRQAMQWCCASLAGAQKCTNSCRLQCQMYSCCRVSFDLCMMEVFPFVRALFDMQYHQPGACCINQGSASLLVPTPTGRLKGPSKPERLQARDTAKGSLLKDPCNGAGCRTEETFSYGSTPLHSWRAIMAAVSALRLLTPVEMSKAGMLAAQVSPIANTSYHLCYLLYCLCCVPSANVCFLTVCLT